VSAVAVEKDVYRLAFDRLFDPGETGWLRERRTAAISRFVEKGFPGPRDEAWRHTPIGPLTRNRWEPAAPSAPPAAEALAALAPPEMSGLRAVLAGGRLVPELSRLDGGRGVEVQGLASALRSRPDELEPHLGRIAGDDANAFSELNTAFAVDGVVITVEPGAVLEDPLHVIHVAAPDEGSAVLSCPRLLVVAGRGSQCRVVETYLGPSGAPHLTSAVTEVVVGDNASVDHYKLQREDPGAFHVATLAARLGRDARFADRSFTLGAAIGRNDIDVRFEGEGGECRLDGLFVVDGERLSDTHSRVDHARPHCSSHEHYKGVLDGRARGVFHGLVVVRPGAQKTDASQMNRNLLLSREALVHSTPQLEILADDVKCRHGSTTGQLDPAALFYLRSRGIGETEARSLLTWAFASDIVLGLPVPALRETLTGYLRRLLPGSAILGEAVA